MALLRFVCIPSTSIFTNKQFFQPINPSSSSLSASFSNRSINFQKPNFLVFQTQSAIEATQIQNSTESVEQKVDDSEEEEGSRTRLLAQNVNWTCTADDIRPLFEKYGTVVDIEISMYSRTKNRGLVFVSMGSHEEALAAFTNLQSYEFMGRSLNLTWAKPKKDNKPSTPAQPKTVPVHNLFVANLPFKARSKDLMEFFSAENTNVVSAEIIFNEKPRGSAGYGFVSFNTKQEAEAALAAIQGKIIKKLSAFSTLERKEGGYLLCIKKGGKTDPLAAYHWPISQPTWEKVNQRNMGTKGIEPMTFFFMLSVTGLSSPTTDEGSPSALRQPKRQPKKPARYSD